jgi:nitrate/nitrite transporter NarK
MDRLNGWSGFGGWQWMFVIEGIPSILLAIVVYFCLADSPDTVDWLDEGEKQLVVSRLDPLDAHDRTTVGGALRSGRMWWLTFIYFTQASGYVGMTLWLPSIIHSSGVKTVTETGLLSAIPYICAIVAMYLISRSADRKSEYRWHVVVPQVAAAIALVIGSYHEHDTAIALACLSVAVAGVISSTPPFWALPSEFLKGTGAAAGIAVISATGNLGGFVSPFLIGFVRDMTGSTSNALWVVAGLLIAGAICVLLLPKGAPQRAGMTSMKGTTEPNY